MTGNATLAKITGMIVTRGFDGPKGWIAGSRSFRIDVEKKPTRGITPASRRFQPVSTALQTDGSTFASSSRMRSRFRVSFSTGGPAKVLRTPKPYQITMSTATKPTST